MDEGVESVVTAVQSRAGLSGINLAVSYHSGMFLLPHNPRRKLYFPQPGLYFVPDKARYSGLSLRPRVDDLAASGVGEALRRETARRGMQLNAWAVCLHNTGLGMSHPEVTSINAFGDHVLPSLCPSNPAVRAYVRALAEDLSARDYDAILFESLEYQSAGPHGYHHEISGLELTPFARYLLGLCFCEHCLSAALQVGVSGARVRVFVREELDRVFADEDRARTGDIGWPQIRTLADGELGAYHDARVRVVTSLYAEIRAAWPGSGPRLEVIDFGPLRSLGWDGTSQESGLDLRALATYVDALHPCPYFASADGVTRSMAQYRERAPAGMPLIPAIRAIPPQVHDEAGLLAHVLACEPRVVSGYTFYNYGFMALTTLDWIRRSLAGARDTV
jgi:hypothetical protein